AECDAGTAARRNEEAPLLRDTHAALARSADALRQSGGRGDEARATLAEIAKRAAKLDAGAAGIVANAPKLVAAKQAARAINAEGEPLYADTTKLVAEFEG